MLVCKEIGCNSKVFCRELCKLHYGRMRKLEMPPCSIEGCDRPIHSNKICHRHYEIKSIYGDPLYPVKYRTPRGEQLSYALALKDLDSFECLDWPYTTFGNGYPLVYKNKKTNLVHRFVCEMVHGEPPEENSQAAHSCGNKLCVNHRHLRWASPSENMKDKLIHGTQLRGSNSPCSKLTNKEALDIKKRVLNGELSSDLAKEFNVSRSTVDRIKSNKRHVEE